MGGMARFRRPLIAIGAIVTTLLAVDVAVFLGTRQLELRFRATLERVFRTPVELRDVTVSLAHGLHVRGLVVRGPSGERAIAIDEASVGIDWRRLAPGEVRIEWPSLDVRIDAQGRVSLLEAIDPALLEGGGGPPELPKLVVHVNHASLRFADETFLAPGQVIGVDDLSVELRTSRDGIELSGRLVDPIAKEIVFQGAVDPRGGALRVDADVRKVRVAYRDDVKRRIPPVFWAAWDLLRIHGTGDIAVHVRKEADRPPNVKVDIEVHDGGLSCIRFPYPAKDVQGRVQIVKEGVPLHVRLIGLRGGREGGTYGCDGEVTIMPKGQDDLLDLHITGRNMPADSLLFDALPPPVDAIVKRFDASGRGDAEVRIHGRLKEKGQKDDVHIAVDAQVRDVRARFDGFPVPVALAGSLSLRDFRFSMDEFRGEAAGGRVVVRGFASPEDVDMRVDVAGALADEALESVLLPQHRRIVEMIRPRGRVHARIDIFGETDPDGSMSPTFRASVTADPGLTARFEDFPYPLVWQEGEVRISPRGATIEGVRARSASGGPLAVTVSGEIRADDVRGGGVDIRIEASRMPVDATLRRAAAPAAATVVAELGPEAGEIETLSVLASVPVKGAPLELWADAEVRDAIVVPERLGVPVHSLSGRIRLEPTRLVLDGVAGVIVDARVRAGGVLSLDPGGTSTAAADIEELDLDEDLEYELPAGLRRVFEMLRPEGRIRARIEAVGGGAAARPVARATWSRGAFQLSFFPLAATGIDGRFAFRDGALHVEDVRGRLGEGALAASGRIDFDGAGGAPRCALEARVQDLPLDRRLVDAFPEANRASLADLAWAGKAALALRAHFDPGAAPGGLLSYVGETTLAGATFDVGVKLEQVEGALAWHGSWPIDLLPLPELEGGLSVRRAVWKDQEIADLTGRFAASDRMLELRELRGTFLGGIATGRFYTFSEAPKLWGLKLRLVGARVERLKLEGDRRPSGLLETDITIVGRNASPGDERPPLSGEGTLLVRNGKLLELPTFAGILSALSLELPGTPAIDDARVSLGFERGRMRIDQLSLSSPAISFTGRGYVENGELSLRLTHELGRDYFSRIPVWGDFWDWLKGQIIGIQVSGPIGGTRVRVVPIPAILDPATWLLEQGTRKDAKKNGGGAKEPPAPEPPKEGAPPPMPHEPGAPAVGERRP
jgi:hypothetical protein